MAVLSSLTGVFINTGTVILGSIVGLLFRKWIPERITSAIMKGLGLCTVYIGISGALTDGTNTVTLIASTVIGIAVGTALDLDRHLNSLASKIEGRFKKNDGSSTIAEAFVSSSLLFCVGAMTIVGSLNAGISGDQTTLITKACLDLVSACAFASALGAGTLFSALFVLVFQGSLVLLAKVVSPLLMSNPAIIPNMTLVGSVIIIALGLNIVGITKLKVMNYIPAIFVPILLCQFGFFC